MKGATTGLAIVVIAVTAIAPADIVERSFQQDGTGKVTSGYVLQGSRNMRNLGKRSRSSVRTLSVPSLNAVGLVVPTQTVIPALQTEALKPKPRFGYGSDYRPDKVQERQPQANVVSPVKSTGVKISQQAAIFSPLFHLYQPREYWPVYRYHHSPFWFGNHGCGTHYRSAFRATAYHSRWSFSFGW